MGLHVGTPRRVMDPSTRRAEYVGVPVNLAARITMLAQGGQVVMSGDFLEKIKESELGKEPNLFTYLGKCESNENAQGTARLYELCLQGLEGRFFGGGKMQREKEKEDEDNSREEEDEILGAGASENNFLNSANLCSWIIDYKDIQVSKQVGAGSYGIVYRGRWKGIDVAVKRFIKQKLTESRMLEFRSEMAFLSQLHHPNVLFVIGACVKKPNLAIVTEFMQLGSLRDMLADRSIKLPWQQRMFMLRGAAMGVKYLHTLEVPLIHRDLKSSNLLVDETMNIKVADFGFAGLKEENATMTRCGAPTCSAPEIIRGDRYNEKADVYSFGMLMWEVLTRKQPFEGRNFLGVLLEVLEGKRPQVPKECPIAYRDMMTRCWHAKAEKRPTMNEVVDVLSQLVSVDSIL